MSSVNEELVREYFEALGFLTYRPVKYQVSARAKRSEEEIDLLVVNSRTCGERSFVEDIILKRAELINVQRAIVSVRGWHTERFTPSLIEGNPELYRFADEETMQQARSTLQTDGSISRIMCLPNLPASEGLRRETIALLREKGIDGILLFRDILMELTQYVDATSNYEKSDLLQMLRILKSYDMLKSTQMEFFDRRRRRPAKLDSSAKRGVE